MPDATEQPTNQENQAANDAAPTTAQDQQRPRTSITSFLFMSFILFMLTSNNGEDILVKNLYIESLRSLQYQQSNYSAWRNASESNFTMPEHDPSQLSLVSSIMSFGNPLDADYASYYENITGFIRGPIKFYNLSVYHNISSSGSEALYDDNQLRIPHWASLAEAYISPANITEIAERAATWNWTACDRLEMRVLEKKPTLNEYFIKKNTSYTIDDISLLHGRLELSDVNTGEELDFDLEAVHFQKNGTVLGFAEPAGPNIDSRLLPSLVPESRVNDTALAVDAALVSQIAHLQEVINSGTVTIESSTDESRITTCTFVLYAQIIPSDLPQFYMQELESELEHPTGINTAPRPPLKLNGVLISKNCALLYVIEEAEGLKSQRFWQKVTTYCGVAAAVNIILIFLLSRQIKMASTPNGLSRLSRWTFFTQAAADSISFIGHITFGVVADGRPSISLVAPAFLSCMLLVSEAHFGLSIQQIQAPEAVAATVTQTAPAPVTTTPLAATDAAQQTANNNANAPTFVFNFVPTTSFFMQTWRRIWSNPQARFWLTILIVLSVFVRVIVSPSLVLLIIAGIYSMFWLPQIIRSARRRSSSGLSKEYLIGTTLCRSYFALYIFACPYNVLGVETTRWIYAIVGFVMLQVTVVISQEIFGAAFFLPPGYIEVPTYDYHPQMASADTESPEQSLGDCSICMEPIIVASAQRRRSLSEKSRNGKENSIGGILSAMQMGIEVAGRNAAISRKAWAVAPCHHIFHTTCLERWLSIKNICPQCRRPLPPL